MKKILSIIVGLLIVGGFAATGNLDKLQELVGEHDVAQSQQRSVAAKQSESVQATPQPVKKEAVQKVESEPKAKVDTYGYRDEGICGSSPRIKGQHDKKLLAMAKRYRLQYPYTFVNVTNTINQTGRLPNCYLTKRQAEDRGWSRGRDLWASSPGHSIGGNHFGNYEGRLPKNVGQFVESDVDFDGDRRGAKRLVFVKNSKNRWMQWLTVDHYDSFHKVDPRQ